MAKRSRYIGLSVALLGMAALLAWTDGSPEPVLGWIGYTALLAVCIGILYAVSMLTIGKNWSDGLLPVMAVAFLVRIVVGLVLLRGLPLYGYDEPPQLAGYVFQDAFQRDRVAWGLAVSDKPILAAFDDRSGTDLYGGTLALSAAIYRSLGFGIHRPMQVVMLSATFSTLAVLLTWAFVGSVFDDGSAKKAAWIVALYPDAVLVGASQMREPYLIAALAGILYGYSRLRQGIRDTKVIVIMTVAVCLALLISPPFTLFLIGSVLLAWLWERRGLVTIRPLGVVLVTAGLILVLLLIGRAWTEISGLDGSILQIFKDWWANAGGDWRVHTAGAGSYWMDNVLSVLPVPFRVPFLVLFGLLYPFLPAAIFDPAQLLWRIVAIWRALGWFMLLPLMIYATLTSVREAGWRSLPTFTAFIVWASALVSSYRAPSYLWDNPRYRVVFIVLQAALAAWAWGQARRKSDPWLSRTFIATLLALLLFSQWYAGRYYGTPKMGLVPTLVGSAGVLLLYLLGNVLLDRKKAG